MSARDVASCTLLSQSSRFRVPVACLAFLVGCRAATPPTRGSTDFRQTASHWTGKSHSSATPLSRFTQNRGLVRAVFGNAEFHPAEISFDSGDTRVRIQMVYDWKIYVYNDSIVVLLMLFGQHYIRTNAYWISIVEN